MAKTPPLSAPDSTTAESLETLTPTEGRMPLKRKSDEDLSINDQKRRRGTEESLVMEEERRVIISMYNLFLSTALFCHILSY